MRKLFPEKSLSPAYIDSLRETIEKDLRAMAVNIAGGAPGDYIVRDLLPWQDLRIVSAGQAGVNTDYWGVGALVASTLNVYVNRVLNNDQFVAIYGVALRDTNPATLKVLLQSAGAASTFVQWSLEEMLSSDVPIAYSPEPIYYTGQKTVFVQLMPDAVGKAVGADGVSDHLVLIGLMCTRTGEVVSK